MLGKASLFLIMAFSGIFLVAGFYWGRMASRAVDNDVGYYDNTIAHNIAVSGANMAATQVYLNKAWMSGYNNIPFSGGTLDVKVESAGLSKIRITSVGRYDGISKKVVVLIQPSNYAKFCYYIEVFPSNTFLFTGDTITGHFHTQDILNVKGSPVFKGKASARGGLNMLPNQPATNPRFLGGFLSGIDIQLGEMNLDMEGIASSGGKLFSGASGQAMDVGLTFLDDGSVRIRTRPLGGSWSADSTARLSLLAQNGLLYVNNGNLYLKGTLNGAVTVVAEQVSPSTGNVYIEDDIVYKNNPLDDSRSTDMLGIVCDHKILVLDNAANRSDVNICATILSYNNGLGLENENMPYSGTLRVFGGLIEHQARITGRLNGSNQIVNGYHEKIEFDERFLNTFPPYFPATGKLEIVSWLEYENE